MAISIGHSAYRGANALSFAKTKAAAIRELRRRGVRRNDARAAVSLASANGYATTRKATSYKDSNGFDIGDVIEVGKRLDLDPDWFGRASIVHYR